MPLVLPAGNTHGSGEQQSAETVHSPPRGWQVPSHLLFTHGFPQQSALYGQTCSTSGQCCNGVPCTSGTCRYP